MRRFGLMSQPSALPLRTVSERKLAMSEKSDLLADNVMTDIWKEWFHFYQNHFRARGIRLSYADQMAFYEIAQPKLRSLADS